MTEEWKEVRDGIEVSSLGRVRRILPCHFDADGYLCVPPGRRGAKREKVHTLVAEAFIGPRPSGAIIRHLNDEKFDNRATNLAYGNRQDNVNDLKRNRGDGYLHTPERLLHLRSICVEGGKWWKGKKRDGLRGKAIL